MAKKKSSPLKKRRGIFWPLMKWLCTMMLWGGIIFGLWAGWIIAGLDPLDKTLSASNANSLSLSAIDGQTIWQSKSAPKTWATLENMPPVLIDLLLVTEDRRFYTHHGVDPRGILRAVSRNIAKGGLSQGGSTLTQQLARNVYFTHHRSFERKLKETVTAFWLDYKYDKDTLLEHYLNRVYFGQGAYGLHAAAQTYFGKNPSDLNMMEMAVLIGSLKAPSTGNLHRNQQKAVARANTILISYVDYNNLDASQLQQWQTLDIAATQKPDLLPFLWVVDYARKQGLSGRQRTTIDYWAQLKAHRVLNATIKTHALRKNISQGAIVWLRQDGSIKAMIGGMNYRFSQYNRASQAKRQSGSAFKLFVLLAAMEKNLTNETQLQDSPINLQGWQPKNYDGKFLGAVDLQTAFAQSRNVPIVNLAQRVGLDNILDAAERAGIHSSIRYDFSSVLGASELSLLELTSAYSLLARSGQVIEPWIAGTPQQPVQAFSSFTAQSAANILATTISRWDGTAKGARGKAIFGKTGTSQNNKDAWFIGITPKMETIGIWLGNDDNSQMDGVTGGGLPIQVFRKLVEIN